MRITRVAAQTAVCATSLYAVGMTKGLTWLPLASASLGAVAVLIIASWSPR